MNDTRGKRWIDITAHARDAGFKNQVLISEQAWDQTVELWGDPAPGWEDEDERIRRLLAEVRERTTGALGEEPIRLQASNPEGVGQAPIVLRNQKSKHGRTSITISTPDED